ncbi:MAG: methyltransferase domain-containing protein [Candidatus Helarchaeota archaeon]
MSEEPLNLEYIKQGLKWLMRRLYLKIAKDEKLDEYLNQPRRFIEIFAAKGYKNLKLTESFFQFLTELEILKYENERYEWDPKSEAPSKKMRTIVEKEAIAQKMVQEKAMALYGILKHFSENFIKVLRGEKGSREQELAIWDSLYASDLYTFLRNEAIKRSGLMKEAIILDLGCRTGWSTISLIEILNPKKVIAIDSSEIMLELAYENILSMGYQDRVKLVLTDIKKPIKLSEKIDGVFANLVFNRYEPSELIDVLFNIAPIIKDGGIFAGLQPIKADDSVNFAELILYADNEFKGYPNFTSFVRAFEKAGFDNLKIEKSMFFKATLTGEKGKKK